MRYINIYIYMIICGIICCSIRLTPLLPVKKFCGVQLYLIYIYIYIHILLLFVVHIPHFALLVYMHSTSLNHKSGSVGRNMCNYVSHYRFQYNLKALCENRSCLSSILSLSPQYYQEWPESVCNLCKSFSKGTRVVCSCLTSHVTLTVYSAYQHVINWWCLK